MLGELFQVDATLDGKGRLVLPARLRKKLEAANLQTIVLMYMPGMSIFGFTEDEWERQVVSRLANADPFNPKVLTFTHGMIAGASRVDVDSQGRVLVPPKLREKAGLTRDIVMQGLMNRIEVWDAARWAAREAEAESEAPRLGGIPLAQAGGAS